MSAPEEIAFLTEQVNRLRRERAEAFKAGQERMREKAADFMLEWRGTWSEGASEAVRALPIEP